MVQSPKNRGCTGTFSDPASVSDVITDSNTTLSSLLSHARVLARVESVLGGHTSPELAGQFQVAAMRQDRLVLLTPTASWATRLRMQAGEMLNFLQSSGYEYLRHIDIRVAPLSRKPVEIPVRKPLSPAAEFALGLMTQLSGKDDDKS